MLQLFNRNMLQKIVLILILIAAAFIKIYLVRADYYDKNNFNNVDEGFYLKYATQIRDFGVKSFPKMADLYINDQESHIYPHPLRVLYIVISSFWMRLFNPSDFMPLYYMSAFFSLLCVIAIYFLGKNLFSGKAAIIGALFAISSPLILAMGRNALQESMVNFFMLFLLLLFYLAIKNPNRLTLILFSGMLFICSALVKETLILFLPFFVICALFYRYYFKIPVPIFKISCAFVLAAGVAVIIWSIAAGGLFNVVELFKAVAASPSANNYAIAYGSGPWYRYLLDYLILSPWTLILFVGYAGYCVIGEKLTPANFYLLLFFIYSLAVFDFFTKNVRYVIFLDAPIRLFAVLALIEISEKLTKKRAIIFLTLAVGLVVVSDLMIFKKIFVAGGVYDPVSYFLLKEVHIVP